MMSAENSFDTQARSARIGCAVHLLETGMRLHRLIVRTATAAGLVLVAALSLAQAQQRAPDYEPSVGQAGKDVVWVPTGQALVDKMLDMANVTAKDFVIDLGSGD